MSSVGFRCDVVVSAGNSEWPTTLADMTAVNYWNQVDSVDWKLLISAKLIYPVIDC